MNQPIATVEPRNATEIAGELSANGATQAARRPTTGDERAPTVSPPSRIARELRLWLVSLALFSPILVPYAAHFAFQLPGRQPTGFIDYDLPYYMANAREHFDAGRFHFFYSNPFDPNYASPRIYVQPMTLALGAALHWTGLDPGVVWMIFHLLAGWVCTGWPLPSTRKSWGLTTGSASSVSSSSSGAAD